MTVPAHLPNVQLIHLDAITVVNPRIRNKKVFKEIVTSIAELGLKKPITVTRRADANGPRYDLVCGQGRLEAYRVLGQEEIPAIVVEADAELCMVMSLVENIARRQHRAIDLLHDIEGLKRRGYSEAAVAAKTGLSLDYVRGVTRLLETGEHRLLRAVESRQIPVSVAVQIADADDAGTQLVLQQAYEDNVLRGRKFIAAKRIIERRHRRGKGLRASDPRRTKPTSVAALLRTYKEDTEKKRLFVRKADAARDRLTFVTEAVRKLLTDENFATLLRAEGLDTLPRTLGEAMQPGASA